MYSGYSDSVGQCFIRFGKLGWIGTGFGVAATLQHGLGY